MLTAHTLRQFTRWVALLFVLSLGAAIASPLVQPKAMSFICSAAGNMKVVVQTDNGAVDLGSHGLDCPMCAALGAPPPVPTVLLLPPPTPGYASLPTPADQTCQTAREPWQARAPPAFL